MTDFDLVANEVRVVKNLTAEYVQNVQNLVRDHILHVYLAVKKVSSSDYTVLPHHTSRAVNVDILADDKQYEMIAEYDDDCIQFHYSTF